MSNVLTDFSDGVAVITINRPEVRNAVNLEVAKAVAMAVDELESRSDVLVGIITGSGGNFCSGMDLKAFADGGWPIIRGRGFAGLTEAPPTKPLIAAVEGWALAGGCELALTADLIVAANDARFGLPEVKRGLVAYAGGLLRLPKTLSYQIAMEMALTGDPLTAEVAYARGLVNVLTEPGCALEGALKMAARITVNAPLAVRASKQIISAETQYADPEAFTRQRRFSDPVLKSPDVREGARAFVEKRAPVWRRQ